MIDRGFVTYSNDAKRAMLGVKTATLATFGAVSKETATRDGRSARWSKRRRRSRRRHHRHRRSRRRDAGQAGRASSISPSRRATAAILHRECRFGEIGRSAVRQRSVVEALRMLTELARGPQAPKKTRRETMSRLRPRVARTPRRSAVERRRPPRA